MNGLTKCKRHTTSVYDWASMQKKKGEYLSKKEYIFSLN